MMKKYKLKMTGDELLTLHFMSRLVAGHTERTRRCDTNSVHNITSSIHHYGSKRNQASGEVYFKDDV